MLAHAFFQGINEFIPFFEDFIFHIEDLLALAALLAFQFADLLLEGVLLFDGFRLPGFPFHSANFGLGIL